MGIIVGGENMTRTLGPTDLPAQFVWNPARFAATMATEYTNDPAGFVAPGVSGFAPMMGAFILAGVGVYLVEKRRLRLHAGAEGGVG